MSSAALQLSTGSYAFLRRGARIRHAPRASAGAEARVTPTALAAICQAVTLDPRRGARTRHAPRAMASAVARVTAFYGFLLGASLLWLSITKWANPTLPSLDSFKSCWAKAPPDHLCQHTEGE